MYFSISNIINLSFLDARIIILWAEKREEIELRNSEIGFLREFMGKKNEYFEKKDFIKIGEIWDELFEIFINRGIFLEKDNLYKEIRFLSRFFENPSLLKRTDQQVEEAYLLLHKKTTSFKKESQKYFIPIKQIQERESIRKWSCIRVSEEQVIQLIEAWYWYQEIWEKRVVPSGWAFYPLDFFYLEFQENDTKIYKYSNGKLLEIKKLNNIKYVRYLYNMDEFEWNNIRWLIVIMADLHESSLKYWYKSLKLAYIEWGHVGQNMNLIAKDLRLGICEVAWVYEQTILDDIWSNKDFIFITAFTIWAL